jgi:hypothetical protein
VILLSFFESVLILVFCSLHPKKENMEKLTTIDMKCWKNNPEQE